MPKVSIVIPCYNSGRFIERTLDSVAAQTFTDWECIIVDDGSTDDGALRVETYLTQDARFQLLRQKNGGVCNARNNGFKACSRESQFLLFLDADDCLEPQMLSVMTDYMDKNPPVGLLYCNFVFVDEADQRKQVAHTIRYVPTFLWARILPQAEPRTPWVSVLCGMQMYPSMTLMRRSVYEQTSGWDEAFGQHHEELNFYLQLALLAEVHYCRDVLVRYRRYPGQSSEKHRKRETDLQWEKLEAKWRHPPHLTARQRRIIDASWRFRAGRVVPFMRIQAATQLWRERRFYRAARLVFGALLHYVPAFRLSDCWLRCGYRPTKTSSEVAH